MKKCKFYKKMRTKGYNRCIRDNSIRKGCGSYCPFYEWSLWNKFIDWLWGVITMPESFPERLKKIRKRKGLTQTQLAKNIGISYQQISFYETGRHTPTMAALEWLCQALGVSATELLGY